MGSPELKLTNELRQSMLMHVQYVREITADLLNVGTTDLPQVMFVPSGILSTYEGSPLASDEYLIDTGEIFDIEGVSYVVGGVIPEATFTARAKKFIKDGVTDEIHKALEIVAADYTAAIFTYHLIHSPVSRRTTYREIMYRYIERQHPDLPKKFQRPNRGT